MMKKSTCKNLQQEIGEWVEIYYKSLLKLANCSYVKATDVFYTTIFRTCLQPYLRLAIIGITKDTLIKHKKGLVICEENGKVITNYNALIIQLEFKPVT